MYKFCSKPDYSRKIGKIGIISDKWIKYQFEGGKTRMNDYELIFFNDEIEEQHLWEKLVLVRGFAIGIIFTTILVFCLQIPLMIKEETIEPAAMAAVLIALFIGSFIAYRTIPFSKLLDDVEECYDFLNYHPEDVEPNTELETKE